MLVYVKRHFGFKSTLEAIWVDGDNNVEELEYSVRLEDAAWFTLKEKWAVLDPRMKIKDLPKILHGDGRTPETCFEAKFRVGGVLIDAAYYTWKGIHAVLSLPFKLALWFFPKKYKRAVLTDDESKSKNC